MIVITSKKDLNYTLLPGDRIEVTVNEHNNRTKLHIEEITKSVYYDTLISFRFCDDNCKVLGDNINIFLGRKNELPSELIDATHFEDLSNYHKSNFISTLSFRELEI